MPSSPFARTARVPADEQDLFTALRGALTARLASYLEAKAAEVAHLAPQASPLVDSIRGLTLRGGKRLRAAVALAAYRAVDPEADWEHVIDVAAAVELLQVFLLIHDDWMDGDLQRRGGPAVHAALRAQYEDDHIGDSLGVLAGDLACTYSWELLLQAPYPDNQRSAALNAFIELQKEVYFGQHLDIVRHEDVQRMHLLKTTSYTVRGPARLGALLSANTTGEQLDAFDRWALLVGEAFQIRDDVIGVFGDSADSGKPGDDLQHAKLTSVVAALPDSTKPEDHAPLASIWGKVDATPAAVDAARAYLRQLGVNETLERRIVELSDCAQTVLQESVLGFGGVEFLRELTGALTRRSA